MSIFKLKKKNKKKLLKKTQRKKLFKQKVRQSKLCLQYTKKETVHAQYSHLLEIKIERSVTQLNFTKPKDIFETEKKEKKSEQKHRCSMLC